MDNLINDVVTKTQGLTNELLKYMNATNRLAAVDLTETAELIECIMERGEIIEKMDILKAELKDAVEKLPEEQQTLVKNMFNSKPVFRRFTEDEKAVYQAVLSLHSSQTVIIDKDKQISSRLNARYEEVKDKLESLQMDKKKIKLYSAIASGKIGSALDSQS